MSQEKVFWKRGATETGVYGLFFAVLRVCCLRELSSRGKWAAWVQTAGPSTVLLTADCWQSLTGSACDLRCLEQSNVIQQSENSPYMKNCPVPGQREKKTKLPIQKSLICQE